MSAWLWRGVVSEWCLKCADLRRPLPLVVVGGGLQRLLLLSLLAAQGINRSIASFVVFVVIIFIFFAVAFVFLFVFFLVWLLSKQDIGSYQPVRTV
jgi:hypothetical protein